MTLLIAEQLYSGGFRSVDDLDEGGVTPLEIACTNVKVHKERWELISWYLDKGSMPHFRNSKRSKNCFLAISFSLRDQQITDIKEPAESVIRRILRRIYDLCRSAMEDSCLCYCSTNGCTPVQLLHKRYGGDWERRGAKFEKWACLNEYSPMQKESCGEELCRLEIFERLGMAHTCCDVKLKSLAYGECHVPSDEECHELREEDSNFSYTLELYMSIYRRLRKEHVGPFSNFWCDWWTAVNDILPKEDRGISSKDYAPSICEIRASVQSKLRLRNYMVKDCEDVFLDSIGMFL